MAVLTPTSVQVISDGNRISLVGTFASVGNADTWDTGLKTVDAAFLEPGVSGQTHGLTYSGGTITVAASGAMANSKIRATGS